MKDTVFWAMELLDSGLADTILRALRRIWFYGFGIAALPWWVAFQEVAAADALDSDAIVRLAIQLARCGRDATAVALLGWKGGVDLVGEKGCVTGVKPGLPAFLARAVWQGRCATAWLAWRATEEGEAWDVLERVAMEKHGEAGGASMKVLRGREGEGAEPLALIAVAACCLPAGQLAERWGRVPPSADVAELQEAQTEWEALLGRRARRVLSIHPDALYWITARGRGVTVYETIEKELKGSLEKPAGIWYSGYWDDVAESYGGWAAIRLGGDDDARESFYTAEFPDDIPDEWSAAEREKSHGRGPLQPGARATAATWFSRWFDRIGSAVVWETDSRVIPDVDGLDRVWTVALAERPDPAAWDMAPVRREIERLERVIA